LARRKGRKARKPKYLNKEGRDFEVKRSGRKSPTLVAWKKYFALKHPGSELWQWKDGRIRTKPEKGRSDESKAKKKTEGVG